MRNAGQKADKSKYWRKYVLIPFLLHLVLCIRATATPTQEDVFKSISENMSESPGSGHTMLAIALGGVALVMLLVLFNSRSKREATPKALNHSGKLLKEIIRKIPLRPAELKQLKLLSAAEGDAGGSVDNPLLFILCPSALTDAMRAGRVKVDKKVMAGLARKLGLIAKKNA
jgi:hypothetical protein